MAIDPNTFAFAPRVFATALVWGGISAFALGPFVAERETRKIGWSGICEKSILAEIEASRPAPSVSAPEMGCRDLSKVIDGITGSQTGHQMCNGFGEQIDGLFSLLREFDPERQAQKRINALNNSRLNKAASLAPTRCGCAVNIVKSDRVRWGLYAGTGRIVGKGVSSLKNDLTHALHSPACALHAGGVS